MTRAALYENHTRLADQIANQYTVPGLTWEDVQQEARLAMWIATSTYQQGKGTTFRTWAAWAIRSHLTDQLKAALREKRRSLNDSVGPEQLELIPGPTLEATIVQREQLAELVNAGDKIRKRRERWNRNKRAQRTAA